uniref:ATP synthase complex subunit 8 n=1 Tax=Trigonopterus sp. AH-2016 TaxID=1903843 RepID=A0A343C453_9CUCU|nr:ATP synthase F0 subunit 8 [Trigonopterus sp. AH-2016]
MPQMAPLNWTLMYLFYIFLFVSLLVKVYFLFAYTPKIKIMQTSHKPAHWKW